MSLKKQLTRSIIQTKLSQPGEERRSITKKSFNEIELIEVLEDELELSPEEERTLIVGLIWQQIVNTALDTIYEKYLEKQTVFFVSHCSRLAWKALLEWKYQLKGKGGFGEAEREMVDIEPPPSPKDSWAGHSISVAKEEDKTTTYQTPSEEAESQKKFIRASLNVGARDRGRSEEEPPPVEEEERTLTVVKARQILREKESSWKKRTEELLRQAKSMEQTKDSHELPPPVMLQARNFPPPRVDVKYEVVPGARGVLSRKAPTVKTIQLCKPHKAKSAGDCAK